MLFPKFIFPKKPKTPYPPIYKPSKEIQEALDKMNKPDLIITIKIKT